MIPSLARRSVERSSGFRHGLAVVALGACVGLAQGADAPGSPCPVPPGWPCPATIGFPTPLPVQQPNPPRTPEELKDFLKGLSGNDSAIEVIVEQGRIITTQKDISVPGQPALVAV